MDSVRTFVDPLGSTKWPARRFNRVGNAPRRMWDRTRHPASQSSKRTRGALPTEF